MPHLIIEMFRFEHQDSAINPPELVVSIIPTVSLKKFKRVNTQCFEILPSRALQVDRR
ncbi:uncharacterized protein PHALS_05029 [Plasmopara halstedii]|uniref:Uncharacterized protein n=1 Tax=Plasmopara halstedii TaxID=4781 RepID=A0A0N7L418_PLAHL|nr:uncharacterized protein PHALS_05029 [Plasmopara halstedii]CEG37435.1 hypothetical protein PHALS_05029 [Plasmopara halstedii]|eukprot:XP_024573804.1 hypothetical protein PHALS_05029 [Plasmopara halstedii]